MQQRADKPFYDLRAGLVTEAGPLNTPDGATVDEQNFHLLIDGSRRRRRGLRQEVGGQPIERPTPEDTPAARHGRWKNAGGDPDTDLVVVQLGTTLHFFLDSTTTLSDKALSTTVSLMAFATVTDAAVIASAPVSFATGNGVLIVTGRYIRPFYVEYVGSVAIAKEISVRMRDFVGASPEDQNFTIRPTTLSAEHNYNLRNLGWRTVDITAYYDDTTKYPSLNMLWHKGYARQVDDIVYVSDDGPKAWNSAKISAEPFGNQSAPRGSLFINPFDTNEGTVSGEDGVIDNITAWSWAWAPKNKWMITLTLANPHGLSVNEKFEVFGNLATYIIRVPIDEAFPENDYFEEGAEFRLNGIHTALGGTEGTTLTFRVDPPFLFFDWVDQFASLGVINEGIVLERPSGYTTDERPSSAAWYAGRVWMAGIAHPELADKILLSQTVRHPNDLGKAYQFNDPTNEALNQLLPTDGGVIQLSDVGTIEGLLPYQSALLVLANNGIWEISGGRGTFTTENFGIRKITDAKCTSPWGFVEAEGRMLFSGTEGVFVIQPDERTGVLYATSITEQSIQTEWAKIATDRRNRAKMTYDNVNKQAWIIYEGANGTYCNALVYDLRLTAWHKMKFSAEASSGKIVDLFATTDTGECGRFSNLKFVVVSAQRFWLMDICRSGADEDTYEDWSGEEVPAFMVMGPDSLQNWQNRRQAPVVHVFSKRTTLNPDQNNSSITMQAQWDWTDSAVTGKWGTPEEVHRIVRPFAPLDMDSLLNDGYPVVVTRNKVRGRGRALQLRFSSSPDRDAHLVGYAIRYHVTGRI